MFFFDKISFPGQKVNFGLYHVLHILKAIVPAYNLSYQKRNFEHPTRFLLTQWDAYVNSILHCVILYIELHFQTNWEAENMVEFYFGLRICFRFVAFWPHIILWKILSYVK